MASEKMTLYFDGRDDDSSLSPLEKEVFALRYPKTGYRNSLEKVSNDLGITREKVRQIENEAFAKLAKGN